MGAKKVRHIEVHYRGREGNPHMPWVGVVSTMFKFIHFIELVWKVAINAPRNK